MNHDIEIVARNESIQIFGTFLLNMPEFNTEVLAWHAGGQMASARYRLHKLLEDLTNVLLGLASAHPGMFRLSRFEAGFHPGKKSEPGYGRFYDVVDETNAQDFLKKGGLACYYRITDERYTIFVAFEYLPAVKLREQLCAGMLEILSRQEILEEAEEALNGEARRTS
jgi:hypothetical protein